MGREMARCIFLLIACAAPLSTAAFRGPAYPVAASRRVRPAAMVFPTLGLTVREQARLSAMRCADEPLLEEMGGVVFLFGVLGAKIYGPIGMLLGSFHIAPAIVMCEAEHASTSRILGAGWHVWRFCARVAAGCVVAGRKARMLVQNSGLIQACSRLDQATHARAVAAALAGVLMWPLRSQP